MNGDSGFFSDADIASYGSAPTGGAAGNIITDFFSSAADKWSQFTKPTQTRPTGTSNSVGGFIFDAIYQYGAGRTELALQNALTQSRAGQQAIANVEQQKLQQYMPFLLIGVVTIAGLFFFLGRR